MTTATSLVDWIMSLFNNPQALAAFKADPEGYAAECGFGDLSADDVHLALDNMQGSFDRSYDTGATVQQGGVYAPPPPVKHAGESDHEYAIRYVTEVTNNYSYVDDRDTIIDNSVNQQIDTFGGNVNQSFDNDITNASGDGAIAVGGDVTGSPMVTGDGNTTAAGGDAASATDYGSGSATAANVEGGTGSGGAVNVGSGSATGNYEDNDTTTTVTGNTGDTNVNAAGADGTATQTVDQSDDDLYDDKDGYDDKDTIDAKTDDRDVIDIA